MASHTLRTCSFCSDFASHCEVCRICPRHSAYCSCTNQINNHTSGLSFSNIGVERTLDNLNYDSDNLYESLFLNCHYHDIVSINEYLDLNINRPNLFLIHFNVRSLQKNLDKLTNYILQMKKLPDIIAITETKLTKNHIVVNLDIEGYNFIHSDSSSRAGGVGFYIKDSLTFTLKEEIDLNINSVENIWIQIETSDNKKPITIGVVYRHPVYVAEHLECFSKAMEELFSKLSSNNKEFYIMGDFNIDLLKAHSNYFIKNYADNLISYSVKCTINKSTRCTINSKTLLDHIYTNNLKYYNFSGIV